MIIRRVVVTLGLIVAGLTSAAPAALADHNFETPSGNISCEYNTFSDADGNEVLAMGCILYDINLGSAADGVCDPDISVVGFLVARSGGSGYGCFDPNEFEEAAVLAYGKSFRRGGITCSAAKSGLTCKNASKRGFKISRSSQRLF